MALWEKITPSFKVRNMPLVGDSRSTGSVVRNTLGVQSAFGTVVFVVCGVGVVGAVLSLVFSAKTWDEYGKHHLLMDSEHPRSAPSGSSSALVERDEEIRQLLEARNARRRRRGEPEVDVEAEIARLTAPQIDAELRSEIRDLVIARNHRRARQGKPPLDIEVEIQREIDDLSHLQS
jgi:hypothetical protein